MWNFGSPGVVRGCTPHLSKQLLRSGEDLAIAKLLGTTCPSVGDDSQYGHHRRAMLAGVNVLAACKTNRSPAVY